MLALELREAPFDGVEVQLLLAEVQQFYVDRYGSEDKAPLDAAEFRAPTGVFWLAVLPDPTRADPARVDPARVDPARVDPTRVDPTRVDPTRVDPAGAGPTGREPTAASEIVGCVGLRRHDPQTAELKRMFLRPAYRRQGLGRAMLLAAERRALELGYRQLILETGHQQPEALSLYLAQGYTETANYGYRQNSTSARSFIKVL